MGSSGLGDALGPLGTTLPHAAVVMLCFLATALAARVAAVGIRSGRALLLLGAWAVGMAAFVAGCVAFQAFAWSAGPVLSLPAVAAFIGGHGVPLASVLVLGTLTAAGIELAHPNGPPGRSAPPPQEPRSRAEAIGALGESLVALQLRDLGWPYLSNVVLARNGWSVEIDHLVWAPDGIVIIEVKTLSGVVSGHPEGEEWTQRTRSGARAFLNPLHQNAAHLAAVRAVIGEDRASLLGLVVSAGKARFEGSLAACVVPLNALADVLRASAAIPLFGREAIERAWAVLEAEAARSAARRDAHVAYARSRKRVRGGWF